MPDFDFHPLTEAELKLANDKAGKPEFLSAGSNRWVVIVNEDGLKKLRDDNHLTKDQYEAIKKNIDAGDKNYNESGTWGEPNKGPNEGGKLYEVGVNGERNRYVINFEGESVEKAEAKYAMSGQLQTIIKPDGEFAGAEMSLNSGLDISLGLDVINGGKTINKNAKADRTGTGGSFGKKLKTDFTLKETAEDLFRRLEGWSGSIIERKNRDGEQQENDMPADVSLQDTNMQRALEQFEIQKGNGVASVGNNMIFAQNQKSQGGRIA